MIGVYIKDDGVTKGIDNIKRRFWRNEQGATVIFFAVILLPVFILMLGLTVDYARILSVESQAQSAFDAAMLSGAKDTTDFNDFQEEVRSVFEVNFPEGGYMGAGEATIVFDPPRIGDGDTTYSASMRLDVNTMFMKLFHHDSVAVSTTSQVTRRVRPVEVALVLDRTGSMEMRGDPVFLDQLKNAVIQFITIVYKGDPDNVFTSIVPFNMAVNPGVDLSEYVKQEFIRIDGLPDDQQTPYVQNALEYINYLSTRTTTFASTGVDLVTRDLDPDSLPGLTVRDFDNDISDRGPVRDDERYKFAIQEVALPGRGPPNVVPPGVMLPPLPEIRVGMTDGRVEANDLVDGAIAAYIKEHFNSTRGAGGTTRINVGLLWGWFTLSPNWSGIWHSSLPKPYDDKNLKVMILVTDGANQANTVDADIDDENTRRLCDAIKAKGVIIHGIFLDEGGVDNEPEYARGVELVDYCATKAGIHARSEGALLEAFKDIANDLVQLRITD